jgi:hypothetical protein
MRNDEAMLFFLNKIYIMVQVNIYKNVLFKKLHRIF